MDFTGFLQILSLTALMSSGVLTDGFLQLLGFRLTVPVIDHLAFTSYTVDIEMLRVLLMSLGGIWA